MFLAYQICVHKMDPYPIYFLVWKGTVVEKRTVQTTSLKVVGNEKGGGSRSRLLLEPGFGPWRSMSV